MTPCRLVSLPERTDERGSLAFAQVGSQIPFTTKRVFHLFNLRNGVSRGGHAHRACHQFLMAMAGKFKVITDDKTGPKEWLLESPAKGLHVPPGNWVDLTPMSDGAILSVLASDVYDEADYIRNRREFDSHENSPTS